MWIEKLLEVWRMVELVDEIRAVESFCRFDWELWNRLVSVMVLLYQVAGI